MSKRGLPTGIKMRHDAHYVEEFASANKSIGKIIDITNIFPNPEQPRTEFGDLSELTSSIREQGVLEPLLVQPKDDGRFMIIAGERRFRASKNVGLTELPCVVLEIDDKTVAEIALVENLQRKDLNVWEVSDGLQDLVDRFEYTHEQIAERIGKSRTSVTESLAIAGLPDIVREKCRNKKIKAKTSLVEISRAFDEAAMLELIEDISGKGVRKAIRAKKQEAVTPKPAPVQSAAETETEVLKDTFSYVSEGHFELSIKHYEAESMSRTDLLRALKEVFDSIKAGE